MKAIIVVDIDDCDDIMDYGLFHYPSNKFVHDVHLKPMPKKEEADDDNDGWHEIDFKEGWNACLDEITGETE